VTTGPTEIVAALEQIPAAVLQEPRREPTFA